MTLISVSSIETCFAAVFADSLASSMLTLVPTCMRLAKIRPMTMASAVLTRKTTTVFTPMRPSFLPSPTSAAAQTSRQSTSGATTMVSRLVRIVPRGFSTAACLPKISPAATPSAKPIMMRVNRLSLFHGLKMNPISLPPLMKNQTKRQT